ncbi:hypothetical protein RD110_15780 [Rhodoferax koreense]|uniref:DUF2591 domain-containing protein n=1 Tax=Rhodoferax koreensis TaxID=1842727 RepID=A0A1P8JXR3_9BURK|nr:hypothetical protein [Rhodoferax koreense]APW38481.1 hypothetical protein RD110_15780 [Rhodoferax koreense]
MSARDLLELAAQAVGNGAQWDCPERGMLVLSANGIDTDSWNPLKSDGDALRLAVALNLNIRIQPYGSVAREGDERPWSMAHSDGDPRAATRAAIVRAAAAVARANAAAREIKP